jgi:hypothetical protein
MMLYSSLPFAQGSAFGSHPDPEEPILHRDTLFF